MTIALSQDALLSSMQNPYSPLSPQGGLVIPPRPLTSALWVGDLDPSVEEAYLFDIFNAIAPVNNIRIPRNSVTRASLGYAYVNFQLADDARKALEALNYSEIKGRACRIMWSQRDPQMRRSNVNNIFIKNLSPEITSRELNETFKVFGVIQSCKIPTDSLGRSKGYGFVQFDDNDAAMEALNNINGMEFRGRVVEVQPYLPRPQRNRTDVWTNLYVKNIPKSWTKKQLDDLFSPFGEITSSTIKVGDDNQSKGFGFVDYKEHSSSEKAIAELNGKDVTTLPGAPSAEEKMKVLKAALADAEAKAEKALATLTAAKEAAATAAALVIKLKGGEKSAENDEAIKAAEISSASQATALKDAETASANATAAAKVASEALEKHDVVLFYVSRAQPISERERLVKEKREQANAERAQKWAGCNLYVRNLDPSVTDDILRKDFGVFGKIISVKVSRDAEGSSKGFGFVCLSLPEEASKAKEALNRKMLFGKPLFVTLFERKETRQLRLSQQQSSRFIPSGGLGGVGQAGVRLGMPLGGNMMGAGPLNPYVMLQPQVASALFAGMSSNPHFAAVMRQMAPDTMAALMANYVNNLSSMMRQQQQAAFQAQQGQRTSTGGGLASPSAQGPPQQTNVPRPQQNGAFVPQQGAGAVNMQIGAPQTMQFSQQGGGLGSGYNNASFLGGGQQIQAMQQQAVYQQQMQQQQAMHLVQQQSVLQQQAAQSSSQQNNFSQRNPQQQQQQQQQQQPSGGVVGGFRIGSGPTAPNVPSSTRTGAQPSTAPSTQGGVRGLPGLAQVAGVSQKPGSQSSQSGAGASASNSSAQSVGGTSSSHGSEIFLQQLRDSDPAKRKNLIGERLYSQISLKQPALVGKITGMLLDGMEDTELLHLIESPQDLEGRIKEALDVLEQHRKM
jgi:polyadenylate-binding protein